jgi:hypothetical protein
VVAAVLGERRDSKGEREGGIGEIGRREQRRQGISSPE